MVFQSLCLLRKRLHLRTILGLALSDVAVLDTLVTVVDGASFMRELQTLESLRNRGWHADAEDQRTIAHLLCDQVEFANVIILNKCDLIDAKERGTVRMLLKNLTPPRR